MTTTEQNQNSEAKTGCAEPAGVGTHPDAAAAVTSNLLILAAMKVLLPTASSVDGDFCGPGFAAT
jgi:hypothetical protein